MAHGKKRKVDQNCKLGVLFTYYCDDCLLELRGWDNKNEVAESCNGWTWVLERNGEEIDSAGNKYAQQFKQNQYRRRSS